MNDEQTTIHEIRSKIQAFSKERGWDSGTNAKDLVMAFIGRGF